MAKPAKPKAAPAAPVADVEFTTDAPRPGPVGDRSPPTEAELIAAHAAAEAEKAAADSDS